MSRQHETATHAQCRSVLARASRGTCLCLYLVHASPEDQQDPAGFIFHKLWRMRDSSRLVVHVIVWSRHDRSWQNGQLIRHSHGRGELFARPHRSYLWALGLPVNPRQAVSGRTERCGRGCFQLVSGTVPHRAQVDACRKTTMKERQ